MVRRGGKLSTRSGVLCLSLLFWTSRTQADGIAVVPVAEILIIVGLVVTAVWLGVGYLVARWKGLLAMAVLGLLLVGRWMYHAEVKGRADDELVEWRRSAWKACEAEHPLLPKVVDAVSVVDTTAGFLSTELMQLLAERSLAFVEVKVATEPERAKAVLLQDCCNNGPHLIKAEWASKPYVRMSLGRSSDPACHPELTKPWWKVPPFLPDTCILAEEIDEPSAELRIEQQPAKKALPRELGWRRLVDVKSGRTVAQLTSEEGPGESGHGAGDRLSRPDDRRGSLDCRKPQRLLADLLRNPGPESSVRSKQLLVEVEVQPDVAPEAVLARASVWPKVVSAPSEIVYRSREEDWKTSGSEVRHEEWAEHVESARQHSAGIAPHGSRLIDLRAATLTRLQLGNGRHRWRVQAALNGFFVTPESAIDVGRLLIRFNRKGELEWAVSVVDPEPKAESLTTRGFAGLVVDGQELALFIGGHIIQSGESSPANAYSVGTGIRVRLDRLPAIEGQRR